MADLDGSSQLFAGPNGSGNFSLNKCLNRITPIGVLHLMLGCH
jgi:hypothetical protein